MGRRPKGVGKPPEQQSADRAASERQRHGDRNVANRHPERRGDLAQHKGHNEEIERVQRPAQITRKDDVQVAPSVLRPADCLHFPPPIPKERMARWPCDGNRLVVDSRALMHAVIFDGVLP